MLYSARFIAICFFSLSLFIVVGCEEVHSTHEHGSEAHSHTHSHGADHGPHAHDSLVGPAHGHAHDHAHDEVELGAVEIGDFTVKLAQGHGPIMPGQESHLVVKLPYADGGSTIVRAWIGTSDRTLSYVGKGIYAASHDDYDIHAMAPDPLPEDVKWWIEIERPDGERVVGAAEAILN